MEVLAAKAFRSVTGLSRQLFSAHMLQHEVLMVLAAPLLCLAQPLGLRHRAWRCRRA